MGEFTSDHDVDITRRPEDPRLEANAIGVIGLATLGAVMMSPALGIYEPWGPIGGLAGTTRVPLISLDARVISLQTAITYALVHRELPSSGSAFAWTEEPHLCVGG